MTAPESTGQTIDLTPSKDGYARIAATYGQSVLSDVRKARQADSAELLRSFVDIVFYLGAEYANTKLSTEKTALLNLRDEIKAAIR